MRRGSKVIEIRSAVEVITQRDLVEVEWLRKRAIEARRAYDQKRRQMKRLLKAGARIEPGIREAKIATREILVLR